MVTTPEQITNHFFFSLRWHDDDNYAWTIYKSFFFFFTMTWWWHLQRLWWCKTIFSYKDIGDADNETFQIDIIHSSIYKIICCQVRLQDDYQAGAEERELPDIDEGDGGASVDAEDAHTGERRDHAREEGEEVSEGGDLGRKWLCW